jgi:hypothetical protein
LEIIIQKINLHLQKKNSKMFVNLRGDFFKSGTRGGGCDKFRKNQILSMYVFRTTIQMIILGLFPDFWDFLLQNGSDFLVKLAVFVVLLKFDTSIIFQKFKK